MKLVRQLLTLKPYKLSRHKAWSHIGNPDLLKLDWNESTIKPADGVRKAIAGLLEEGNFNYYPDINNEELRQNLAVYAGVGEENLEFYSSSDGAHEYIFRTYGVFGKKILIVGPTYDNLRVVAESSGLDVINYTLDVARNFSPCEQTLVQKIKESHPDFIYVCNPNNPTSTLWPREQLIDVVASFPDILFLIDEAYVEFGGDSVASDVHNLSNLIVSRTFSKAFGLAGLRFGYLIASEERINDISLIRNAKSVNSFAQVAVSAALAEKKYYEDYCQEVMATKEVFSNKLRSLGLTVFSQGGGNFVLVNFAEKRGDVIKALEREKIFIRDLSHLIEGGFVRITVGTSSQMARVSDVICSCVRP